MIGSDLVAVRLMPGTKVSHDMVGDGNFYPYSECVARQIPCAIHCMRSGIVVIDVDIPSASHKFDGTIWWKDFSAKHSDLGTYVVGTSSGGYHFYYRVPEHMRPSFKAPKTLALGVDVKWNGYVGAPPSEGYIVLHGDIEHISVLPPSLALAIEEANKGTTKTFEGNGSQLRGVRPSYSNEQILFLQNSISNLQSRVSLSRDHWRDGIFSLRAGTSDRPEVGRELAVQWTMNLAYTQGDEFIAEEMFDKADPYGDVGPGTIITIIQELLKINGMEEQVKHFGISLFDISHKEGLNVNFSADGKPKLEASEINVSSIVGSLLPEEDLYYDVRQDLYMYKGEPCDENVIAHQLIPTLQHPSRGLGLEKFKKSVITSGLETLLHLRQKDPHKEFLNSITWDGVERTEKFFINFFGVADTPYHRRLGNNFWAALAARGLRPGCKFDSVLILEGGEGIRKSSFVEVIGGEYTYAPSDPHAFKNLDCLRQMHQAVVVELPELLGLLNEADETVKAVISQPHDTIRALYAKKGVKKLRGFIFIGTTNSASYLSEGAGMRRFWPLVIPPSLLSLDLEGIKTLREQLFAEGKAKYRGGYDFWHMPTELLEPEVKRKQNSSALVKHIAEMVEGRGSVTILQIYQESSKFGVVPKRLTASVELRIKAALTSLGYVEKVEGFRTSFVKATQSDKLFNSFEGLL